MTRIALLLIVALPLASGCSPEEASWTRCEYEARDLSATPSGDELVVVNALDRILGLDSSVLSLAEGGTIDAGFSVDAVGSAVLWQSTMTSSGNGTLNAAPCSDLITVPVTIDITTPDADLSMDGELELEIDGGSDVPFTVTSGTASGTLVDQTPRGENWSSEVIVDGVVDAGVLDAVISVDESWYQFGEHLRTVTVFADVVAQ